MRKLFTILILLLGLKTMAQVMPTNSMPAGTIPVTSIQYQVKSIDGILEYWGYDSKNNATRLFYTGEGINYYFLTKVAAAAAYQPKGTYVTTETDPTVPAYSKSLTAFSVVKSSTDALYPTQTGFNASGTWGISITGNAQSATNLQTSRTINGVPFNGTSNIQNTTDQITEGTSNLYWTAGRSRNVITANGLSSYVSTTGVISTSISNITNGYGISTLLYNGLNIAAVTVDNTVIAPLANPFFTGAFDIQPLNSGASPTFSNSPSGQILSVRRNMFAGGGRDEAAFVSRPASVLGSVGGFSFWGYNSTNGTSGGLVNLGDVNGVTTDWTFPNKIIVGNVQAATSPTGFAWWNSANKQFETITPSQASALISGGGTGFANPMTAPEDLIKGSTGGAPARLPVGTNGQVLTVTGGVVGWATQSASTASLRNYGGNPNYTTNPNLAIDTDYLIRYGFSSTFTVPNGVSDGKSHSIRLKNSGTSTTTVTLNSSAGFETHGSTSGGAILTGNVVLNVGDSIEILWEANYSFWSVLYHSSN